MPPDDPSNAEPTGGDRPRHDPSAIDPLGRPTSVFDPMLQHERTALAWERTAIATMVTGVLFARYATRTHVAIAVIGIVQVVAGAALLVWTGVHYERLHGPLRRGQNPAHRRAAVLVGLSTVVFTGAALVVSLAITLA